MNSDDTQIRHVISLLEGVVDGSLDAREALSRWPPREGLAVKKKEQRMVDRAWVQLHDYIQDEDIRDQEPEYGRKQIKYLLKKIYELKLLLYT